MPEDHTPDLDPAGLAPCPFCGGRVSLEKEDIFVCAECGANVSLYGRDIIAAWNLRATTAGEPVEVAVKPLEWREHSGDQFCYTHYDADALGGSYTIEERKTDDFDLWLPNNPDGGRFSTLADAKAAAQADYEKRIRSALRAHPSPDSDRLREALDLFISYGCPVCHGDCASANPPVAMCPMQAAHAALSAAPAGGEVERLREALRFYADIGKYPAPLTGGMGALWKDCGQIARAALNEGGSDA